MLDGHFRLIKWPRVVNNEVNSIAAYLNIESNGVWSCGPKLEPRFHSSSNRNWKCLTFLLKSINRWAAVPTTSTTIWYLKFFPLYIQLQWLYGAIGPVHYFEVIVHGVKVLARISGASSVSQCISFIAWAVEDILRNNMAYLLSHIVFGYLHHIVGAYSDSSDKRSIQMKVTWPLGDLLLEIG